MNRSIVINIDRKSWPAPPALPRYPRAFMGIGRVTMNVPAVLLKIGYLTTPPSSSGVSLSEFWAYVRYLAAITNEDELQLTTAFADLDAHQKTILSDDFGMGFPMTWLTGALGLREPCDGRYFLDRFAAQAGAASKKKAKRGPNKTPDFLARDGRGIWHVIECKGTQSGSGYQRSQIGSVGPPATGGIAQKQSIVFPRGHTGQRLVCALSIAIEDVPGETSLRIVDPEPEDPLIVGQDEMEYANDALQRSTVAKALRLAGYEATADVTAAPLGKLASSRPDPRRRFEQARVLSVEERDAASREELERDDDKATWMSNGGRYRGRQTSILLPRPLLIDGRKVEKVNLRQGVNQDVLLEMRSRVRVEDTLSSEDVDWADSLGVTSMENDDRYAAMQIGDLYRSDIQLE